MFMNRREHLLNMKNKYLTKCLCITMAAAISFTGTASRVDFIRAGTGIGRDTFSASRDYIRAGTGTSRVCTDAIRAHRNTS